MTFEDFRVGSVIDNKLRLERLIAAGGGGAVFEASHVGLRTRVAVKVLRSGPEGPSERRLQRFIREARIAARLRSPHAVRILDVATPRDGTPYLVMEYLHGETLGDLLRRSGPLPIPDAIDYVLQAIEALAEMHAAGIVHRDVKPSNLFLVQGAGGTSMLKLLDFGVATPDPSTEAEVDLTITDAEIGTPLYMAPEQYMSAKYVDARVDVWSLGVTLYQLLTGSPPFTGYTIAGLSMRILHDEPTPLDHVRPEVPAALAEIVKACLAKEPAARIANVTALSRALAPFAGRPRVSRVAPALPSEGPGAIDDEGEDETETLHRAFEELTPPPLIVPLRRFVPKTQNLFRIAALPTAACVLFWMVIAIGRAARAPEPVRAQAVELRADDPKAAPEPSSSDARILELPASEEVRVRAVVTTRRAPAAVAPSPRGRSTATGRATSKGAPPKNAAPTSRAAPGDPEPIDDRIE